MQSRIYKDIQDLIAIVLILPVVFFGLNNQKVRPQIQVEQGKWTIEKRERKLLMGITGHTFLEMRDENNNVVGQLHGFATDIRTGQKQDVGRTEYDYLKVWEYEGDKYKTVNNINIGNTGVVLLRADENTVKNIWATARSCGAQINLKNIKYPKYGFKVFSETENSNSVAHSIVICSGLEDKEIGLFTPGEKAFLLSNSE
jgi:hypothetical protein